jgi:hypothetical protein
VRFQEEASGVLEVQITPIEADSLGQAFKELENSEILDNKSAKRVKDLAAMTAERNPEGLYVGLMIAEG